MSLETLRADYPWPAERPDLPFDGHGWCQPEHRAMLARYIGKDTGVIVELGSWLGQSTRLMLELAPVAAVICVDHWKGDKTMNHEAAAQARLANAYDLFLANQWEWRDRVIPLRKETRAGLHVVANAQIQPDLIYFDAEHTTDALLGELRLASRLFPRAQLYGDDWGWDAVRAAVNAHVATLWRMKVVAEGNAWAIVEEGE